MSREKTPRDSMQGTVTRDIAELRRHEGEGARFVGTAMRVILAADRARRRIEQLKQRAMMLRQLERSLFGHRMPLATTLIAEAGWRRDSVDAYCPRCGSSRAPFEDLLEGCGDCRGRRLGYAGLVRLGRFAPPLSQWVPAIKHRAWQGMGVALGRELADQVAAAAEAGVIRPPELVVAVPTHWTRRLTRGIDHVHVLSEALAKRLGVPLVPALSARLALHQTGASKLARLGNKGRYRLTGAGQSIRGRNVLLVDDVRTTGSTLRQAGKALAAAEPLSVTAAVCAAVDSPRRNAIASQVAQWQSRGSGHADETQNVDKF